MSKNKIKIELERCMNEAEKEQTEIKKGLVPKTGHENQPKWVALKGTRNCKTLGKPRNYLFKAIFAVTENCYHWVKKI